MTSKCASHPQRRTTFFNRLNLQKWSETLVKQYILTSKCASCHNGVHFFDIATSKSESGPGDVLYIFDLEMCFAGHNGVHFFDIATSKSGPTMVCFVHFDSGNVLRAINGVHFFDISTSKSGSRDRQFLTLLTSKCASRHNGAQFFIAPVASWLRTRRFSDAYFSTLRSHKSLEKQSVSRLSYLFTHLYLLSSYILVSSDLGELLIFLFSLPLPCSAFHLSILSEV